MIKVKGNVSFSCGFVKSEDKLKIIKKKKKKMAATVEGMRMQQNVNGVL